MSSTGLLNINLTALVANWLFLQDKVREQDKAVVCAAVVKADAYGLGVKPVSSALMAGGCQNFFVASLIEAIELREHLGIVPSIFVLSGISHGLGDEWYKYQLIPVLFDVSHIDKWIEYCDQYSVQLPCVLKVDTGMHRLGMGFDELNDFIQRKTLINKLNPIMLMSHLACADLPSHSLNSVQLQAFLFASSKVKTIFSEIKLSLSNSAGCFLGQKFYFDICRPGAALYGVNPTPGMPNPMKPVVELFLPVIQIKTIHSGDVVGYGGSFVAKKDMRIAVVFGGYADGLFRILSNKGFGFCDNKRLPLIGRVSMDSMVFDISELDNDPGFISIINEHQSVDDLAELASTIGYEILTSLGQRYKRVYIQ